MTTLTTTSARGPDSDEAKSLWLLAGMLGLSIVGHVATMLVLPDVMARAAPPRNVEMEFYEPPPPPPPPPKEEEPKPEPPKPVEKIKIAVKLPEPVPVKDVPPPPNEEPPPETPQKPVPIVVGISMSSTTQGGGFAVQVGNTTYGKSSDKIVDPSQVKAYAAPKYLPPGGADTDPVPLGDIKVPYPDEAKKNEIEGSVLLNVQVDATGAVTAVSVIKGPGYGLNEAAREALKRFKFRPATKGGEPVGTSLIYTYTFLLD